MATKADFDTWEFLAYAVGLLAGFNWLLIAGDITLVAEFAGNRTALVYALLGIVSLTAFLDLVDVIQLQRSIETRSIDTGGDD